MSAQQTITKPAATKTATKAATVRKPTPKKAATKVTTAQPAIKYAVADFARPRAGAALAAHTAAFLTLSGIATGQAYPKAKAAQVLGRTAISYHLGNGNLEATPEGLTLTDKGRAFFTARGEPEPELFAAYQEVLTKGTTNEKANVKTEAARVAIG